ncbi:cation efflux family-domain-containing protein [Lineolata rhizophorae]|uniref:Cation efflux family-domain-containing protein n=1 Tax=Lineolata rhizophorae TaxID=578093 RepID=A0A6A6PC24_9PEZI|nr:cation efflux family-domain-containing protein [Lineolata rhizophorae]
MGASTTTTQIRGHAGHGHGHHHHHHHDTTYLTSTNKKDAGVKITRIGLYVNLGMAVGKGIGGYVFHSQALVADAVHSLTDLVSDIMTLATLSWSLKPPTQRFPHGFGKIESLGSLGVSGLLLTGGVMMGWAALLALAQQFFPDFMEMAAQWGILGHDHGHGHGHGHSHSHSHSPAEMGPNINAAWLAAGSIVIKEWLYRATLKIAKERKSSVLASNAYHHRVDSLTAFVALVLITGSNYLENAAWLDPVGGLVISLMVIQAGWGNTRAALLELADASVDEEVQQGVRRAAEKAVASLGGLMGRVEVRKVQGVKSGQNYLMDVEVGVPGTATVEQVRGVERVVRERVSARVRGVKMVRVRFAPAEEPVAEADEFVGADVSPMSSPEPEPERGEDESQGPAASKSKAQPTRRK